MKFGETVKKLRLEADMTQEGLSELLSITPQAVSRWETGMAMPDISLLPSLANLFNVTTDYLLGMDIRQRDARYVEFEQAYRDYWKKDKEASYQMAKQAVKEYPRETKYVEWLASCEYFIAMTLPCGSDYCKMLEHSIEHYKFILKKNTEKELQNKALHGIVLALRLAGRNEEATEYAMMQEDEEARDELLMWCIEGEEKRIHLQKLLARKFQAFLFQISFRNKCQAAYEAVEQILKVMMPDENYLEYHLILQYNSIDKAFLFCSESRWDEALESLKKARHHAEGMVKIMAAKNSRYTSPLFDCLECRNEDFDSSEETELDDFFNCLKNNHCFDPIRDREDFKALETL